MCIAAISKSGGFPENELRAFFRKNRNGGGYAWVDEEKVLRMDRYITDEEVYVQKGLALAKYDNLVTHCRITTQGTTDMYNAHPFPLMEGGKLKGALVHNGHFYNVRKADVVNASQYSDTRSLAEGARELLIDEELMQEPDTIRDVGDIVGTYNKMIILYPSKNFVIINEKGGMWSDGRWYSNDHWKYFATNIANAAKL